MAFITLSNLRYAWLLILAGACAVGFAAEPADPIARLQRRIDRGEAQLSFDAEHGYLASVLRELKIPVASQGLVFSKTSFQSAKISAQTPRALYFNDDVYIGWVQDGDVIEVAAVDPREGPVFYTLPQQKQAEPKFIRQDAACMQCHQSPQTAELPGFLMRSVFPDGNGQPIFSAGTFVTTDQSPFKERWGGWYADGKIEAHASMANAICNDPNHPGNFTPTDLKAFDLSAYLGSHSDVVALSVLAHQTRLHNLMTQARDTTLAALRQQADMAQLVGTNDDVLKESTRKRIAYACEPVVRATLFSEAVFSSPIAGSCDFASSFQSLGPRDHLGRSLRDFDLQHRLFRYPCSYLIYSEQFDALPDEAKRVIYRRLWQILTGRDASREFSRLTDNDCDAIYAILADTKRDLPDYWKPRR
jgi:hypothetical protein